MKIFSAITEWYRFRKAVRERRKLREQLEPAGLCARGVLLLCYYRRK